MIIFYWGLTTNNSYGIINIETRKGSANMIFVKIYVFCCSFILVKLIRSLVKDFKKFMEEERKC